jgi:hypothetical protein
MLVIGKFTPKLRLIIPFTVGVGSELLAKLCWIFVFFSHIMLDSLSGIGGCGSKNKRLTLATLCVTWQTMLETALVALDRQGTAAGTVEWG